MLKVVMLSRVTMWCATQNGACRTGRAERECKWFDEPKAESSTQPINDRYSLAWREEQQEDDRKLGEKGVGDNRPLVDFSTAFLPHEGCIVRLPGQPGCSLVPHDPAITNDIVLNVSSNRHLLCSYHIPSFRHITTVYYERWQMPSSLYEAKKGLPH